jgi:hypothetical protein
MLHRKGSCPTCDKYAPDLQDARTALHIACTDEDPAPGWRPCPATLLRSREKIELWPGNRPEGYKGWDL